MLRRVVVAACRLQPRFYSQVVDKSAIAALDALTQDKAYEAQSRAAFMDKYKEKLMAAQLTKKAPGASSAARPAAARAPIPRKELSEILKLDKIADQDPAQILEVWHAYHANRVDYVGAGALTSAKYALLRDRMHRFPQFVLPLERDGGTEMFLAQFGNQKCAFTSLAEYQLHGEHSSPYSVVEFFPELMESKGMALYRVRHDSQAVEAKDCGELLSRIFDFYILDEEKFKFVETFNERPAQFDYTKLLEIVKEKE